MSTSDSPEADNVYSVRGRSMQIEYDEAEHTVTFYMADIGSEIDETAGIQQQLEDLGIYTRVQEPVNISHSFVKVKLKPAANVELRAPPEDGTTLEHRPITKQVSGSTISKRRGKYGYTATVPEDLLRDLYDIDEDAEVSGSVGEAAVYTSLHDGHLCLHVLPEERPHSLKARLTSTGQIGVPNGLAAAADLDGHGVDWELANNGGALVGHTTFRPDRKSMPVTEDWRTNPNAHPEDKHHTAAISHVTQQVSGRTQSHFNVYVKSEFAREMGWGADPDLYNQDERPTESEVLKDYVAIRLINLEGKLGIYLTDEIPADKIDTVEVDESDDDDAQWESFVRSAPSVRKLYRNEWNDQLTFSFPHSLSYAMEFTDEWYRITTLPLDHEKVEGPTESESIIEAENDEGEIVEKVERLNSRSSGKQVTWALVQREDQSESDAYELDLLGDPKSPDEVERIIPADEVDDWLDSRGLTHETGIIERTG